jgi:hypothetical protein
LSPDRDLDLDADLDPDNPHRKFRSEPEPTRAHPGGAAIPSADVW